MNLEIELQQSLCDNPAHMPTGIETNPEIVGVSNLEIKQLIKSIRKEQELTQEDMADKLGVSRSTYEYWESGKHSPDAKSLLLLLLMRAEKRKLKLQELFC